MTTYTYADGYVATQVTVDRETRAIADVADLGTLPAAWVTRLGILRAYIITCIECAKAPDDMWSVKLSAYRKEYADAITQARIAQSAVDAAAGTMGGASIFSVELLRG